MWAVYIMLYFSQDPTMLNNKVRRTESSVIPGRDEDRTKENRNHKITLDLISEDLENLNNISSLNPVID